VILSDAGPLIALFDRSDQYHTVCTQALTTLPPNGLLTTWPCLTEAMYFLGLAGGFGQQDRLFEFIARGALQLFQPFLTDQFRARELMRKYANVPMDLADASIVILAEQTGYHTVFTLDSDFQIYRIKDQDPFTIVP
jgi:predicted nucleic acid-binding protein